MYQRDTCFELFRAIALKAGPVLGPGDEFAQMREHLATVTHAEGKAFWVMEKVAKARAQGLVEEDRFRPSAARPEHITVGKPATGNESIKLLKRSSAFHQIAHMHIDGIEPGSVESGSHFDLPVHTLIAQHGDHRPGPSRQCEVRGRVQLERNDRDKARIIEIATRFLLFVCTGRVVAKALHPPCCVGPFASQFRSRCLEDGLPVFEEADHLVLSKVADSVNGVAESRRRENFGHGIEVSAANLNDGPEFFGEELLDRTARYRVERDFEPCASGESHFDEGGEESSVGSVMVGEDPLFFEQRLDRFKEAA